MLHFILPLNVASSSRPIFNFQKFSLLVASIFLLIINLMFGPEIQQVLCLHQSLIHKHDLQKCKFISRHSLWWQYYCKKPKIKQKNPQENPNPRYCLFKLLKGECLWVEPWSNSVWVLDVLQHYSFWFDLALKKTNKKPQKLLSSPEASSGCRSDSTLSETSLFLVSGPCEAAKMQSQLFHFDLSQRKWTACRITKFVWTHLYSQEGTETQSCALQ